MLQDIRNNMQGVIAKVIVGFVILTFALFGAEAIFQGGVSNDVAEVNGSEITEPQLLQAVFLHKRQVLSQMGDKADPNMLDDNLMRKPALDKLIDQRILLTQSEQLDLKASEPSVDQMIVQNPAFQQDGKFSNDYFAAILRSSGFTPLMYKRLLTDELSMAQLSSAVELGGFAVARDAETAARYTQEKRDLRYVTVSLKAISDKMEVSEDELNAYYSDNQDKYFTEEMVEVEYIDLKISDFYPEVSDADVEARYQELAAAFVPTTQKTISHILLELGERNDEAAQQELGDIKAKVVAGESFAALAKQYSEDVGSKNFGGQLGATSGDTFPEEIETAIIELKQGEISAPVKTDAGWHLISVDAVNTDAYPSLADKQQTLKLEMQTKGAEGQYLAKLEQLGDASYTASNLSEPAAELGLSLKTLPAFTHNGGEGLAAKPAVIAAAFSDEVLKDGHNSTVIELSDSQSVVVRVKQHMKPELKPLATVKADIDAQVRRNKALAELQSIADKLTAEISAGKSVEEVAKSAGLSWQSNPSLTRSTAGVDFKLLEEAFRHGPFAEDKLLVSSTALENGDIAVFTIDNIKFGEIDGISDQEKSMISTFLSRSAGQKDYASYIEYLKANADIQISANF